MKRCYSRVFGIAVVVFWGIACSWIATPAWGQAGTAALSGVVQDEQNAAIPNASVTIKNVANGATRELKSNGAGLYDATNLAPGVYDVTVKATGFSTLERKGITLTVGAQQTLDLTVKVGGLNQTVQVTAEAPVVESQNATISATVEQKTVVELPLNGRDWTQLATLEPGINAVRTQASTTGTNNRVSKGFGNQLTDAGHRPYGNTYMVDGLNINDYSNGAPGNVIGETLGVDAIQEFSVVTLNYGAEYGRTSGAVINAVSKSGTNTFHGTLFEFDRERVLNTRNFFDPAVTPAFAQHQYGGSAGGPIKKNKMFIFGDYEAVYRRVGNPYVNIIPSAAARAGLMCPIPVASGTSACTPHTITIRPDLAKYLALWPDPNKVFTTPLGGPNDNGETVNWTTAGVNRLNEKYITTKFDYTLSEKDNLAVSFFMDHGPETIPDILNNYVNNEKSDRYFGAIGETHIFSSTLVNSFRVGINRTLGTSSIPSGIYFNPAAHDPALAIPNSDNGSIPLGPPTLTFANYVSQAGSVGQNNNQLLQNSGQLYDDMNLTKGKHSIAFGLAYEHFQGVPQAQQAGSLGNIAFQSSLATAGQQNFVSALQNFLLGNAKSTQGAGPKFVSLPVRARSNLIGLYVRDIWRVSSNFTVNYGLRYEFITNPTDAANNFGRVNAFPGDPTVTSCPNSVPGQPFVATTVSGCTNPISNVWTNNPTKFDFAPRIGIAWDPFKDGKTSIRAAYGIFDNLPLPNTYTGTFMVAFPYYQDEAVPGTGVPPAGAFPNIVPYVQPGVTKGASVQSDPSRDYVQNWNLNIQRQLTSNLSLMVAYVGSHAVHLDISTQGNYVLPTLINGVWTWPSTKTVVAEPALSNYKITRWAGTAQYEGFLSQLQLRNYHGFSGKASYTKGRCYSNGDSANGFQPYPNSLTDIMMFDRQFWGPCDFDLHDNFVGNLIYATPGVRSGPLKWVASGWQLGGIVSASSGAPFSLLTGGDPLNMIQSPQDFPNAVAGCNPYNSNYKSLPQPNYLNQSCFVLAPTTPNGPIMGNLGRNNLWGPGLFNIDFSVLKNIPIRERANLQMRFEFFNVLNHTNFATPIGNNTLGGSLGLLNSTQTASRQIQLGAKIIW